MLYLASKSPRRQELLAQIGLDYRLVDVAVDETPQPGESPPAFVRRVALAKARAGHVTHPDHVVLGADTAIVVGKEILGKPRDRADAVEMLSRLSGQTHRVLTGVAIVSATGERYRLSDSRVSLRAIGTAEALAYWESGEPADKAGAYAIQGLGAVFVKHLSGSYSGVVGLPLFETAALLGELGLGPARIAR